jgi:hypothetical protein
VKSDEKIRGKISAILIFPFLPQPPKQIKDKKKRRVGNMKTENGKQGSILRGGRAESEAKKKENFFLSSSFAHAAENSSPF